MLLAIIVFISFFTKTVIGFGSNVIIVALASHFYPIEELLPVIVPLSLFTSTGIIIRHPHFVDKEILWQRIIPFTFIGVLLGITVLGQLTDSSILKTVFGVYVLGYASFELSRNLRKNKPEVSPLPNYAAIIWLLAAGVLQGIYACGGPLLVVFANRQFTDKHIFRGTLASTFLFLVIILLISYYFTSLLSIETAIRSGLLLPFLMLGFVLGDWLHFRINQKHFTIAVLVLLFFAGLFLIV